jgi:hypothetical protein
MSSVPCTVLQTLDAYGQRVNTDDLTTPGAGSQEPSVAVSINETAVFLSGVQTQTMRAGVAVLDDLRLVAEPGVYTLQCSSQGLTPADVQVLLQHCLVARACGLRRTVTLCAGCHIPLCTFSDYCVHAGLPGLAFSNTLARHMYVA